MNRRLEMSPLSDEGHEDGGEVARLARQGLGKRMLSLLSRNWTRPLPKWDRTTGQSMIIHWVRKKLVMSISRDGYPPLGLTARIRLRKFLRCERGARPRIRH